MVSIEFSKAIKTRHGEQKINARCSFSSETNGKDDRSNIDQQIAKFIAQLRSQNISFVDIIEYTKLLMIIYQLIQNYSLNKIKH